MAWIESHTVLSRHRKVKETARALRLRPAYLIGHLHLLWHAALEQQEDGDLSKWTDEFLAECADYPGDAPQFVRLLQEHKWLDGRLLHDWPDYAGKYLMAKYAKDHREKLLSIWSRHGRIYGKTRESLGIPNGTQFEPKPTVPNPTYLPRGEERARVEATQADVDRAKTVLNLYPSKASKDRRPVKKSLLDQNALAAKIAKNREYPWEEHAQLECLNPTPLDLGNWVTKMPDEVAIQTLRDASRPENSASLSDGWAA